MLRDKSNARSDCKGPCPVEFQKPSRRTQNHSVLKRLGFFTIINLLECTLLQFMTTALYTVLKRVCLIYKAHVVIERLHLSPCFCLLFRLNTWIPLQPLLAHHISRPCSLRVLDSLVFVSLSLSYWCDHNQTDYSRDIPKQQTDGNSHHSPHGSSTVNLHPHSSTTSCSFPTRTRRPFSGMLLLHPPARSSLLNSSIFHSAHAPSLLSSLWVPALPSGTPIPPPKGAVIQELADGAFRSTCWSVLTQFHPSSNSRKDSLWPATDLKLQTIDCLSLTVQSILHHSSNPYPTLRYEGTTWRYIRSLAEYKWFPLFSPSVAEAVTVGGSQVSQARFFLDTPLLAVSSCLPVLHMPRNSLYENLIFNILRERGEADQCLVPWILFLAFFFFEHSNVCPFPVIRVIHVDKNYSHGDICQLTQHPQLFMFLE